MCRAFHCVTLLSQSFPAIPDNSTKVTICYALRFPVATIGSKILHGTKLAQKLRTHKSSCERGECTSNASRDVVIGERSTKTKWREPLVEAVGWSQFFDAEFSRCKLNELGRKVGRSG